MLTTRLRCWIVLFFAFSRCFPVPSANWTYMYRWPYGDFSVGAPKLRSLLGHRALTTSNPPALASEKCKAQFCITLSTAFMVNCWNHFILLYPRLDQCQEGNSCYLGVISVSQAVDLVCCVSFVRHEREQCLRLGQLLLHQLNTITSAVCRVKKKSSSFLI